MWIERAAFCAALMMRRGDNALKRILPALLMVGAVAGALSAFLPAAPVMAGQSKVSEFVFGKAYNDGVTAIRITSASQRDQPLPLSLRHPMPSGIREAQATVSADKRLMQAIADRGIALKNVIQVQRALNGAHVIYYR